MGKKRTELEVAPQPPTGALDIADSAISVAQLQRRMQLVQQAMKEVMEHGVDYGVIPGTPKPTLLKPGAEKLCSLFQLDPQYEITETPESGDHLSILSRCVLYHAPTGHRLGSGMGLCTTKETRYAFRHGTRLCPMCHQETIIKGKAEFGGGWVCFVKKGGCGAKFEDEEATIASQVVGKVPNENPTDQHNTAVKMANKRSLVAAVLNVTAASAIFTQDLEDEAPLSDHHDPVAQPQRQSSPGTSSPISDAQRKRFFALARKAGWDEIDLKAWLKTSHGITHSADIPSEHYTTICHQVELGPARTL